MKRLSLPKTSDNSLMITGSMALFYNIFWIVLIIFLLSCVFGDQMEARGMPHVVNVVARLSLFVMLGIFALAMGIYAARQAGIKGWTAQTAWLLKRIGIGILGLIVFMALIVGFVALALHFR